MSVHSFEKINSILQQQFDLNSEFGFNLFHNYRYREFLAAHSLQKHLIEPSITIARGVSGADLMAPDRSLLNIESKSKQKNPYKNRDKGHIYKCKGILWEWDKQNDDIRRDETFEPQAYVFSLFLTNEASPILVLYTREMTGIEKICSLLKEKQEEKIKEIEICKVMRKRLSRDVVKINFAEIIDQFSASDFTSIIVYDEVVDKDLFFELMRSGKKI